MQFSDARLRNAILITAAIIASVFGWLVFEIPKGTLSSSGDEMLTAERSREMLLLGRSEVHFNFSPSFEKPPLQYWLTSFSLASLPNRTLAVRIWPWLYGVLTAVVVAMLALVFTSACGFFVLAAPFAILVWKKAKFGTAPREISIACLAVMVIEILFNFRHVRYIEPIIPALCLLLAMVADQILRYRGSVRVAAIGVLAMLLLAGFVQTKLQIAFRRQKDLTDEKRVAEELGTLQRRDVPTVLVKAVNVGSDLHFASFHLFHGDLRFPVSRYTVDEIRQSPPPAIGVCISRDFPVVQAVYPGVNIQFTRDQFIIWKVDGPKTAEANL